MFFLDIYIIIDTIIRYKFLQIEKQESYKNKLELVNIVSKQHNNYTDNNDSQ